MKKHTYISEKNRPFLANCIDGRIYELKNESAENYIEIDGIIKQGLTKESKISEQENTDALKKIYADLHNKRDILKTREDEIKLINFVHEFFNAWSSEYGPQFPMYPNEIIEPEKMNFKEFRLNEASDQSVLKQDFMADSASLFFTSGKCYKLIEHDEKQIVSIVLNNKKFSLQYESQIEEFDSKYFDTLQKKFDEKIKKFILEESKRLQEIDKKYQSLEQELQAPCKENGTGIGLMRKNGENFLYVKKDPFIIEFDGIEYGWFPECKIGVRINVKNGKYSYDFAGRRRPIILDPDYYEHPAVYGLEPGKDENKIFKNPTICIATCRYYPQQEGKLFSENNKKELIEILFELFHRLQLINHLDKDAIVPHRLSDPIFAKYKNLGVPKK